MEGFGELTTPQIYYKGAFRENRREGKGFFYYRDGSAYHGNAGTMDYHEDENGAKTISSLGAGDEHKFRNGIPHNILPKISEDSKNSKKGKKKKNQSEGKFVFPDGSVYVGEVKNNQITGKGKYTRVDGSSMVGFFKNGRLHGKGTKISQNGYIETGIWRNGRLHGSGTLRHRLVEHSIYEGSYRFGMFDGRGTRTIDCADESQNYQYDGFYKNGLRDGYGTLNYDDFEICKDRRTEKVYYQYEKSYVGRWRCGKYCNRGLHVSLDPKGLGNDKNYFTSSNLDKIKYPALYNYFQEEDDLRAKIARGKRSMHKDASLEYAKHKRSYTRKFDRKYKKSAVNTEYTLQQKEYKRKERKEELEKIEQKEKDRRKAQLEKDKQARKKAILKMIMSAQTAKKVALEERDKDAMLHMKDKHKQVEKELLEHVKRERIAKGKELSAAAKAEAQKLHRININRRKQGLNPLKSLKDAVQPKKERKKKKLNDTMIENNIDDIIGTSS